MANQAVLQVRMDPELKASAESLYRQLGTSLAEAVRIFARQSVAEGAMPFSIRIPIEAGVRPLGIADGEFDLPDDIDADNDAIAEMFGANL